jgi:hypothetical protein
LDNMSMFRTADEIEALTKNHARHDIESQVVC